MAVYAFSDIHAQYDLWQQIKEYIKPDDTVYCLGDCVDRGYVGLQVLNEVLNTPNIILLCGNHEDFIRTIGEQDLNLKIYTEDGAYAYYNAYEVENLKMLWACNGAQKTINEFESLSFAEQKQLISTLYKLPTHAEYLNTKGQMIYMCHAGRQPHTAEVPDMHNGKADISTDNYLWDRFHLYDKEWYGKDNEFCVHGHSPVQYVIEKLNFMQQEYTQNNGKFGILRYCNGHKIDIDLGSFDSHTACLLNLDTLEPIYFKDRTNIGENND